MFPTNCEYERNEGNVAYFSDEHSDVGRAGL